MIALRPVGELGGGDFGWLKARHHFRVGADGNPAHGAIGSLYVWNDDDIAPGAGFPLHGHRDVEIVTYVREGLVLHTDSTGGVGRIQAGDVQVMSAGTGIQHSESSAPDQRTKIFQIWLKPRSRGGAPRWDTKPFPQGERAGRFVVLASGWKEDEGAVPIHADARVVGASLAAGQTLSYTLAPGHQAYLVPTKGRIKLNGVVMEALDGAAVSEESSLDIEALDATEIVWADVL